MYDLFAPAPAEPLAVTAAEVLAFLRVRLRGMAWPQICERMRAPVDDVQNAVRELGEQRLIGQGAPFWLGPHPVTGEVKRFYFLQALPRPSIDEVLYGSWVDVG